MSCTRKMTMRDPRHAVRRDAPFVIWTDPMELEWSEEERRELALREDTRPLLEPLAGRRPRAAGRPRVR